MDLILIALSAVVIYLSWIIFRQKKLNTRLYEALVEQSVTIENSEKDKVKEDFLKFVSDSREWAFNYIEDVQKQIGEVLEVMNLPIENIESKKRKSSDEKTLIGAYKKLKDLLPEQGN